MIGDKASAKENKDPIIEAEKYGDETNCSLAIASLALEAAMAMSCNPQHTEFHTSIDNTTSKITFVFPKSKLRHIL